MNICLYGASSDEIAPVYPQTIEAFGRLLAQRGHTLVYGGGAAGLMGAAARGVTAEGGSIIGVAPRFFSADGVLYQHCTEFVYTDTMRQRKQIMEDRSEGFVMVPGGIGTFEEFFEVLTLKQLGQHQKPIAIYNINGYFDDLEKLILHAMDEGFMQHSCKELYAFFDDGEALLEYLEQYRPTTGTYKKV